MWWKSHFQDFIHLMFPESCAGCGIVLLNQERMLCTTCLFHLPQTDFHLDPENETARQLWGKLEFQFASSMLRLSKDSIVETLIHKLKYANQPHIGVYLGERYGKTLLQSTYFNQPDLIIPIPIHHSKLRKRGYNQSAFFARGLSQTLGIRCEEQAFIRHKASVSQTEKSRMDRYDNVENVFQCADISTLQGKHILLVDDVLTTGATIAVAGQALIEQADCRISVVTIARA